MFRFIQIGILERVHTIVNQSHQRYQKTHKTEQTLFSQIVFAPYYSFCDNRKVAFVNPVLISRKNKTTYFQVDLMDDVSQTCYPYVYTGKQMVYQRVVVDNSILEIGMKIENKIQIIKQRNVFSLPELSREFDYLVLHGNLDGLISLYNGIK